jgi:hypothetical protein
MTFGILMSLMVAVVLKIQEKVNFRERLVKDTFRRGGF